MDKQAILKEINAYQEQLLLHREASIAPPIGDVRAWAEQQAALLAELVADPTIQLEFDPKAQRYLISQPVKESEK